MSINKCDIDRDRQPPKLEIVLPLELQQIASKFQRQVRDFRPRQARIVSPSDYDNDRQPEMSLWPPNRKYLYLWNYDRYRMTIPTANLGFSTTPSARNWPRVIATRTDNRKWQYNEYIRSGRQSCNFWKWIIVAIIWLIFYRARQVRKSGIWRWNFDAICQSSRDVIISGLGAISILIALVLTCKHYFLHIRGLKPQDLSLAF